MAEQYKKTKYDNDNKIYVYLMKRLFEEIQETDACNMNIIDSMGNIIGKADSSDKWAFTMLDKFIILIKKQIGDDNIKSLLSNFEYIKNIDPLFIMNMPSGTNLHKVKDTFDKIITIINDKEYLPESLYHNDSYVEINEETMNYCDYLSKALTIATFLIYAIRFDRLPTSVEFDGSVVNSVESTFNVRSIGSFDQITKFCEENKLTEYDKITKDGIRMLVRLSKVIVDGNILNTKGDRIENQSHNWKRLAGVEG